MHFDFACYSDIGKRSNNEDCCKTECNGHNLLAVVADGLGGHANGEVASRITVDTILAKLSQRDELDEDELIYALLDANKEILKANIHGHSTAAALWLREDYAVAAHVGDSRIYQFRDGQIKFQSVDHSHVQMAVLVGELKITDVRHHKDRNRLFRVLGDPKSVPKMDSKELRVMPGDRFLLCTDGFWEAVTEEQMLASLKESASATQWLDAMKSIVLESDLPSQDNHTAISIFL